MRVVLKVGVCMRTVYKTAEAAAVWLLADVQSCGFVNKGVVARTWALLGLAGSHMLDACHPAYIVFCAIVHLRAPPLLKNAFLAIVDMRFCMQEAIIV